MCTHHNNKKLLQKALFDKQHKAQPKLDYVGDKVLLKQEKNTTKPPFDPHPYNVIKVKGCQITAQRNGQVRVRDKSFIKVLQPRPPHLASSWQKPVTPTIARHRDFDIEGVIQVAVPAVKRKASSSYRRTLQIKWNPCLKVPCNFKNRMETEATASSSEKEQQSNHLWHAARKRNLNEQWPSFITRQWQWHLRTVKYC